MENFVFFLCLDLVLFLGFCFGLFFSFTGGKDGDVVLAPINIIDGTNR